MNAAEFWKEWVDNLHRPLTDLEINAAVRVKQLFWAFAEAYLAHRQAEQWIPLFTEGQTVSVNHPRYRGEGTVAYDTGARKRVIGVLLENGNTWEYEVETVRLLPSPPKQKG